MDSPLVSIIMLSFNSERFIKKAIQSVINQTYTNWELLIIDNGSTDNTKKIIKSFDDSRIRFYIKENSSIPQNRQFALDESNGKYVSILDSDDVWSERKKIELQIRFLNENPNISGVGTQAIIIDANDRPIGRYLVPESVFFINLTKFYKNPFINSTMIFKKEVAIRAGGYSKDNTCAIEDYEIFLKILDKHNLVNLRIYTTFYRRHVTNNSKLKGILIQKQGLKLIKIRAPLIHKIFAIPFWYLRLLIKKQMI